MLLWLRLLLKHHLNGGLHGASVNALSCQLLQHCWIACLVDLLVEHQQLWQITVSQVIVDVASAEHWIFLAQALSKHGVLAELHQITLNERDSRLAICFLVGELVERFVNAAHLHTVVE